MMTIDATMLAAVAATAAGAIAWLFTRVWSLIEKQFAADAIRYRDLAKAVTDLSREVRAIRADMQRLRS